MNQATGTQTEDEVLAYLRQAIRTTRFGAIEVVIHDGRVVQIERTEKYRFDAALTPRERVAGPAAERRLLLFASLLFGIGGPAIPARVFRARRR
jgi:hypothetical protein